MAAGSGVHGRGQRRKQYAMRTHRCRHGEDQRAGPTCPKLFTRMRQPGKGRGGQVVRSCGNFARATIPRTRSLRASDKVEDATQFGVSTWARFSTCYRLSGASLVCGSARGVQRGITSLLRCSSITLINKGWDTLALYMDRIL